MVPWVHRLFIKDRMRFRERYHRSFTIEDSQEFFLDGDAIYIIPNALFFRKYLSIWETLASMLVDDVRMIDHLSNKLRIIILESTAESMDLRNLDLDEAVNSNERDRVAKLVKSSNEPARSIDTKTNNVVTCFPDLSYRYDSDTLEDEMESYSQIPTLDRSEFALQRAGRMILNCDNTMKQENSNRIQLNNQVLLLSDSKDPVDLKESSYFVMNSIQSMLNFLLKQLCLTENEYDSLLQMCEKCDKTYNEKNSKCTESFTSAASSNCKVWTDDDISKGLQKKSLHRVQLLFDKHIKGQAYVHISGTKYYISGKIRALPGDTVAVQILPQSEWITTPMNEQKLISLSNQDDDNFEEKNSNRPPVPTATIVKLLRETGRRLIVATLQQQQQTFSQGGGDLVTPMDTRYPKIYLMSGKNRQHFFNRRILIKISSWAVDDNHPCGHYVQVIGPVGDLETEVSCLLIENELEIVPFSTSALACLPREKHSWSIGSEVIEGRKDFRKVSDVYVFSVDPPGCQDIDDAMHARVLPNGDYEVGVHIADVTHFLPQGSALDKEAAKKATTFYLVDRRFDMLPSLLSSDLCSLHGGKDRLAMSVVWTFTKNDWSHPNSVWMGRSVIHNCQAMTYDQAHNILLNHPPDPSPLPEIPPLTAGGPVSGHLVPRLKKSLKILTNLGRFRRLKREKDGAIDLSSNSQELKFRLDDNGIPIQVTPKLEKEIHRTIAEMMIMANEFVAEKIYESFPHSSLLRVHRSVDKDTSILKEVFKAKEIKFENESDGSLASSLRQIQAKETKKEVTNYISSLATRVLSEAQYVCTGDAFVPIEGWRHFGLGLKKYTHFTSPIRRYADVVVHRLLLAAISKENDKLKVNTDNLSLKETTKTLMPLSKTKSIFKGEGLTNQFSYVYKNDNEDKVGDEGEDDDGFDESELDDLIDGAADIVLCNDVLESKSVESNDEHDFDEDFLDSLIEGASKEIFTDDNDYVFDEKIDDGGNNTCTNVQQKNITTIQIERSAGPFDTNEVVDMCIQMNNQNRKSKITSMQCQSLFLSLFFRKNIEFTTAVVVGVRANGLLVFVPKFDFKGPVFLSDKDGILHIPPSLLGLNQDNGVAPSPGFATVKGCRRFANGRCILQKDKTDHKDSLLVQIRGTSNECVFNVLDVISVQLSCETADDNARIPHPRIHIVHINEDKKQMRFVAEPSKITSQIVQEKSRQGVQNEIKNTKIKDVVEETKSLYQILLTASFLDRCDKNKIVQEYKSPNRVQTIHGRFFYNSFQNPDVTRPSIRDREPEVITRHIEELNSSNIQRMQTKDPVMNVYDRNKKLERQANARSFREGAKRKNSRMKKNSKK